MVSNVYNYYLSQYAHKDNVRHDNHKKSELKNTYNRMLRINRDTPVYKLDVSDDALKYAIDLKENARDFANTANDLSSLDTDSFAFKKSATSNNPEAVDVKYVGENNNIPVKEFQVDVTQLATSQINTGNYLQPNSRHIAPGSYNFDLNISNLTYEFEFNVAGDDNTTDVQNKISRLINRSNIGLTASVLTDSLGNTAISIESESTGIANNASPTIFNIEKLPINNEVNADAEDPVDVLGLNRVVQYPANAIFAIDGNQRSSVANQFTINNAFELHLNAVTEDSPVTISIQDDDDSVVESISQFVDSYNKLISVADNEENDKFNGNIKLRKEFASLAQAYDSMLSSNGLNVQENGTIEINSDAIKEAAHSDDGLNDVFQSLGSFKKAIQRKAEYIAINPMNYVNNKIVAYKNPQRPLNDPYNISAYSGVMFNGYI